MISKVKGERETPHWFFISLVVSSKKGGSALVLNFLSAPFSLFGISDIWGHNTYIKKCFIHHGIQQLIILLKSSLHWNRILMRSENGNAQRQTD